MLTHRDGSDITNITSSQITTTPTVDLAGNEVTVTVQTVEPEPSEAELFDLYEKIAEVRPGTRDAEIFQKIREWVFSDHSVPPCKFAGISRTELNAWQKRHRINLSSGHIRPSNIDLERGYAWGRIRMTNHVNHLRSEQGPPSADELLYMH